MSDTTPITSLKRLCEVETQERKSLTEWTRKLTSFSTKKRSVSRKQRIREDLVGEIFYGHVIKDSPEKFSLKKLLGKDD